MKFCRQVKISANFSFATLSDANYSRSTCDSLPDHQMVWCALYHVVSYAKKPTRANEKKKKAVGVILGSFRTKAFNR